MSEDNITRLDPFEAQETLTEIVSESPPEPQPPMVLSFYPLFFLPFYFFSLFFVVVVVVFAFFAVFVVCRVLN